MAIRIDRGRGRRQSGITLVEVLAALTVGAMLTVAMVELLSDLSEDREAAYLKRYQQLIADASQHYVEQNWLALRDQLEASGGSELRLPLEQVRNAGWLPTGWSDINSYGQSACLLVRAEAAGSEQRLRTLLVTEGGRTIPMRVLWPAATVQTHGAGILEADSNGMLRAAGLRAQWQERFGADGGFSAAVGCSGAPLEAGHLATWLSLRSPAELAAVQAVMRKGANASELTTVMGGVALPDVAVAPAAKVGTQAANDPCTTLEEGAFGATSAGDLLLCLREGNSYHWRQADGLAGGATRFGGDEVIITDVVTESTTCNAVGELARVADGALAYCGRTNASDLPSTWQWHKVGGKWKYVLAESARTVLNAKLADYPEPAAVDFSSLYSIPKTARAIQANVFLETDPGRPDQQVWAWLDNHPIAATCCGRSLGITFLAPNGSFPFYVTSNDHWISQLWTRAVGYIDDDL